MSDTAGHAQSNLDTLEADFSSQRLHHAILMRGKSLEALERGALRITRLVLSMPESAEEHPDLFHLRPTGKTRRIEVGATRSLISNLHRTAVQGAHKIAIVHEADRMKKEASNAFLKTLEEPPAGTFILLLSTRPYSLLATIRSRCLQARVDDSAPPLDDPEWLEWLDAYADWIRLASDREAIRRDRAAPVFAANALILRLQEILARMADEAWKARKSSLPEGLDDKELAAMEAGVRRGARTKLLTLLEEKTRDVAVETSARQGLPLPGRKLARVIETLEQATRLLELNLKEETALEHFWLTSLRTWSAK